MKKLLGITIAILMGVCFANSAFSSAPADQSLSQDASIDISSTAIFAMEWAPTKDAPLSDQTVEWTDVVPDSNLKRPDGHQDGKPDIGIHCKSNADQTWCFKMHVSSTLENRIKYYMPQPINRNTGNTTDGQLAVPTPGEDEDWPVIATSATKAYTSGSDDKNNTPFGTGIYFDLALDPTGMKADATLNGTLTYTLTTTL